MARPTHRFLKSCRSLQTSNTLRPWLPLSSQSSSWNLCRKSLQGSHVQSNLSFPQSSSFKCAALNSTSLWRPWHGQNANVGWSGMICENPGFQVQRSGRAQSKTSLKGISPCLSEFQVAAGFSLRWNKMRQQALRVPTRQWLCPWPPRTFTQRHSNHTATLRPLFCSTCQNDGLNCLQGKLHLL